MNDILTLSYNNKSYGFFFSAPELFPGFNGAGELLLLLFDGAVGKLGTAVGFEVARVLSSIADLGPVPLFFCVTEVNKQRNSKADANVHVAFSRKSAVLRTPIN